MSTEWAVLPQLLTLFALSAAGSAMWAHPLLSPLTVAPQFTPSQFRDFCQRWDISHVRSTPHYPQSNGHAEAAVKAMKTLINKTTTAGNLDVDAFQKGLLEGRNTPNSSGQSPAQALYGRPLTSFLFAHHRSFAPEWQQHADTISANAAALSAASASHYDRSARSLRPLRLGDHVDVQDHRTKLWNACGVVVGVGRLRDYFVKLTNGRVYWRNRRFLRPLIPAVQSSRPVPAAHRPAGLTALSTCTTWPQPVACSPPQHATYPPSPPPEHFIHFRTVL